MRLRAPLEGGTQVHSQPSFTDNSFHRTTVFTQPRTGSPRAHAPPQGHYSSGPTPQSFTEPQLHNLGESSIPHRLHQHCLATPKRKPKTTTGRARRTTRNTITFDYFLLLALHQARSQSMGGVGGGRGAALRGHWCAQLSWWPSADCAGALISP